uniref:CSON000358 protein n=1 Tax=Culicoides sonorensis TaxID=179676 RepID=A0A336M5U4_CULSO
MVYEEIPTVDQQQINLSKAVRNSLWTAQTENRVITGLTAAVKSLSSMPEDALFCFLAPSIKGDTASHMHEVLLKAFCFENEIYMIEVDSSEKLSRILGTTKVESCALIQRQNSETEALTTSELDLIDFCEDYWDSPNQPIIKIPDK